MRKRLAAVAQSVERVIGNDEVGSSNLLNSSTKTQVERLGSFAVFGELYYQVQQFREIKRSSYRTLVE